MTGFLRSRGLVWSLPAALFAILVSASSASWLEARPMFDQFARVPAVVLGGLLAAVLVAPGLHRVDDEVEGAAPRPTRVAELGLVTGCVAVVAALAVVVLPSHPLQRGGLELARDVVGLAGLSLLAGSLVGSRLAWLLPFVWAGVSYFAVTRYYDLAGDQATLGWLMFPATYLVTWGVAIALFVAGLSAYAWGGLVPRPRRHPMR